MARLFLDTSAVVKRYYEEDGSEVIETASALRRKQNRGEITSDEVDGLLSVFFDEALDEFVILPTDESFSGTALDLVLQDDLRTLDSLQLAAALSVATGRSKLEFVCADRELLDVAADRGLDTRNPETD